MVVAHNRSDPRADLASASYPVVYGMDLVDRQLPRHLTADDSDSHLLLLHSVSLIRDFRDPQDRLVDRRRMRGPAVT